jgi:hypothetical protein
MNWRRKQVKWQGLTQAEKVEYLKIETDYPNNSIWLYLIVTTLIAFLGVAFSLMATYKIDYALTQLNMTVGAEMQPQVLEMQQDIIDVMQVGSSIVLIFAVLVLVQIFLWTRTLWRFNKQVNEKRGNQH